MFALDSYFYVTAFALLLLCCIGLICAAKLSTGFLRLANFKMLRITLVVTLAVTLVVTLAITLATTLASTLAISLLTWRTWPASLWDVRPLPVNHVLRPLESAAPGTQSGPYLVMGSLTQDAPPVTSPQGVADLIRQLESDQFQVRQKASSQLWRLGPDTTAIPLYRLSLTGTWEGRQRADELLRRFRINFVPGMDPKLAQILLSFQNGALSDQVESLNRLIQNGDVLVALKLARSSTGSRTSDDWINSLFNDLDSVAMRLIQQRRWDSLFDLMTDPGIIKLHPAVVAIYLERMGVADPWIQKLEGRIAELTAADELATGTSPSAGDAPADSARLNAPRPSQSPNPNSSLNPVAAINSSDQPSLKEFDNLSKEDQLAIVLGRQALQRSTAEALLACLYWNQGQSTKAYQIATNMEDGANFCFYMSLQSRDWGTAAVLVDKLPMDQRQAFLTAQAGTSRAYAQALCYGWSGDRAKMRQLFEEVLAPSPERFYETFLHVCALLSTADPSITQQAGELLKQASPAAGLELFAALDQLEQGWLAVEFPIQAAEEVQMQWFEKQFQAFPQTESSGRIREVAIEVATQLAVFGRKEIATKMFRTLLVDAAKLNDEDNQQALMLISTMQNADLTAAALEETFKIQAQLDSMQIASLWFNNSLDAVFWLDSLDELEAIGNKQESSSTEDAATSQAASTQQNDKDFAQRMALIGRLTRTSPLQTFVPEQFPNTQEVQRYANRALQFAAQRDYGAEDALLAAFHALQLYQLHDPVVQAYTQLPSSKQEELAYRRVYARSQWSLKQFDQARIAFWLNYQSDPSELVDLVFAALPNGFDPGQFLPSAEYDQIATTNLPSSNGSIQESQYLPLRLSTDQLHASLQQFTNSANSANSPGDTNVTSQNDTGAPKVSADQTLTTEQIQRLAQLHLHIRPLSIFERLNLASQLTDAGCDLLAYDQLVECRRINIWTQRSRLDLRLADQLRSVATHYSPQQQQGLFNELILTSLMQGGLPKSATYALWALASRTLEVKIQLGNQQDAQALTAAQEILQISPSNVDLIHYLTQHFDSAPIQTANPPNAADHNDRLSAEGDQWFAKAYQPIAQQLLKYPDSGLLCNNLAWLCVQGNRQLESAEKTARHAIQMEPGTPNYPDTLADTLIKMGRIPEAKLQNLRSRQLSPSRSYYRRQQQRIEGLLRERN